MLVLQAGRALRHGKRSKGSVINETKRWLRCGTLMWKPLRSSMGFSR